MMWIRWQKIIYVLQLARLEFLFASVSNLWLIVMLAPVVEPESRLSLPMADLSRIGAMGVTAVIAAGLAAFGIALNDVLDVRHDRTFSPQRPIPAGRVAMRMGVVLALVCLLAALLGGVWLGRSSAVICLMAAVGAILYNTTWKHLPATGIIALGLMWALSMFIPHPHMGFVWPVAMNMTHVMACATIVHYLRGKRPRFETGEWIMLASGWLFWTGMLVALAMQRGGAADGKWTTAIIGPAIAFAMFAPIACWIVIRGWRPLRRRVAATRRFARLAILWVILYDAAWMLSLSMWREGVFFLVLFIAAAGSVKLLDLLDPFTRPQPTFRLRIPSARSLPPTS